MDMYVGTNVRRNILLPSSGLKTDTACSSNVLVSATSPHSVITHKTNTDISTDGRTPNNVRNSAQDVDVCVHVYSKSKAIPLHAMEALGGRGV
jgi:hypothetical protein